MRHRLMPDRAQEAYPAVVAWELASEVGRWLAGQRAKEQATVSAIPWGHLLRCGLALAPPASTLTAPQQKRCNSEP